MKKLTRMSVMLAAVLVGLSVPVSAQKSKMVDKTLDKMDFGLVYTYKWSKISTTTGPEFNPQGGAVDVAYTPVWKYKGLGIAADINGEHSSAIRAGVDLSQMSYVVGPRYTVKMPIASFYGEALFGMVHAFDSVFPGANGPQTSANGFASQYGGGLNIPITPHIAWRVVELDWIYTRLPNNNNGYQSDTRASMGAAFHF